MRKIDDRKLYQWFVIVTFAVGVILGAVSYYSILFVEPKVEALLDAGSAVSMLDAASDADKKAAAEKVSGYYSEAYRILRNPQIFGRYEYFDSIGMPVKSIIKRMDRLTFEKALIPRDYRVYLNILLERRMLGSRLGRNTMVFFFLISLIGAGFWMFERSRFIKNAA